MRVLVVEDEAALAAGLRVGLVADGFAVDVARSGTDGLWLAREQPYDAIVLDIMLPGLNGYVICRTLRAEGVWVPILMPGRVPPRAALPGVRLGVPLAEPGVVLAGRAWPGVALAGRAWSGVALAGTAWLGAARGRTAVSGPAGPGWGWPSWRSLWRRTEVPSRSRTVPLGGARLRVRLPAAVQPGFSTGQAGSPP